MDVTQGIRRSFADEHVIGIDPPMRPDLANIWRRRINAFAGRALSDKAMSAEQALRSGMQRLYGLALTPGNVEGLKVRAEADAIGAAPADARIQITPGFGIARSGEDVSLGRTVRLPLGDLTVVLRADHADALEDAEAIDGDAPALPIGTIDAPEGSMAERIRPELPRKLGPTLAALAADAGSATIPHVAVLVAQPIAAEILGRPVDPCGLDPRDDAYVDLQRIDGARLLLYLWPGEMVAVDGGPDYALPADNASRRNRLAWSVFDTERLLAEGEMHPWEAWGVPLALIGFDADWKLAFVDAHAVARTGGTPKERSPLVPGAGDARLWQAQLDQLTGHLTDLPSFEPAVLQDAFARVPPVGVLPATLFDPALRRQHFFPAGFGITALPVAHSNFNLVVAESAGLAPLDRGTPGPVELLVPVPDSVYEPGLLQIEREDPRFGKAIKEIRADRQRWLVRRQMGRRRYDRLMETVTGAVMGWPGSDLPFEENSPAPYVQTPVEVTRTRKIDAKGLKRSHIMAHADATLTVSASDTIWCWVCIHDAGTLTGLSLRLGAPGTAAVPALAKGVYWGNSDGMPIAGEPARLPARRAGDLPEDKAWIRLEVPASAIWDSGGGTLDGFAIGSIEFTQRGGIVEWGAFGKQDAAGLVYTYIADDAPAGAALTADDVPGVPVKQSWPWTPVAGREEIVVPDFGTVLTGDVRRAAALDKFRDRWTQDFLGRDLASVNENGIGAFLDAVDARLKATNDAIDLGFVRARADIYRVRQIMLGADAASRLVTSPSLADLALRDEGARATSKGIAEYLTRAVDRDPDDSVIKIGGSRASAVTGGGSSASATPTPGMFASMAFQPSFMTLNTGFAAFAAAAPTPAPAPAPTFVAMPLAFAPMMTATNLAATTALASPALFQTAVARPALSLNAAALNLSATRYRATDIQRQIPIAGLVERTISVAERLTPQPAVQALQYALASKAAVVSTLAGLLGKSGDRPAGIWLEDLRIAGYRRLAAPKDAPTLLELVDDLKKPVSARLFEDADKMPDNQESKHEADYFTYAVQAIDNSVATMRLVEGRVALFEDLAEALRALKDEVLASANEAAAWLRSVDVEVAEARHDLGTAERLREEERERVEAVNARRAAILATHMTAVAWRRARAADVRDELPLIEAASGLAPSAVAVCLREHDDVPDEIHDYVQLLREVPVSWFPATAAMVRRIERLESAHAAIRTMIERALYPRVLAAAVQVTAANRYLQGVQSAMVASRRIVEARRVAVAALDAQRIRLLSLAEVHTQLTTASTIGDLIAGTHRQPALTRAATEEIDGIASIAGCLHESFGEVPAIVRLGWAETLSSFDRAAPLENLAGLPGWGEVPVELRRTLQGFVDWLFGRIDRSNDDASDAINELVRVCLLMAAHAPVDKIIPAHLVTPVPAKLGSKLLLTLDIARVRRGMTTLVRDDRDRIISRAVIDDIVDGRAQATVTQISAAITTFTPAMRFQLMGGAAR